MNLIFILVIVFTTVAADLDAKHLRCLVCQATMDEMDDAISKIDPKKTVEVSGYGLDLVGNKKVKTVPQVKSEIFLSEMLDSICDKMDDYARATWKNNGQLTLLKLMTEGGSMNPDMSRVDFIQDGDLNKSLKYYCEGIVDENEDSIIKHFKSNSDHKDIRVCSDEAKLCSHTIPDPDEKSNPFEDEL